MLCIYVELSPQIFILQDSASLFSKQKIYMDTYVVRIGNQNLVLLLAVSTADVNMLLLL